MRLPTLLGRILSLPLLSKSPTVVPSVTGLNQDSTTDTSHTETDQNWEGGFQNLDQFQLWLQKNITERFPGALCRLWGIPLESLDKVQRRTLQAYATQIEELTSAAACSLITSVEKTETTKER